MFKLPVLILTVSALILTTAIVQTKKASASPVFQGKATTGEEVYLETNSINAASRNAVKFEYKIGIPGKKFDFVKASANCYNGMISPQNPGDFPAFQPNATGATRSMYNAVCGINSPTSTVRSSMIDQIERNEPMSEVEYIARANRVIRMMGTEDNKLTLYMLRNSPETFVKASRLMCQLRQKGMTVEDAMEVISPDITGQDLTAIKEATVFTGAIGAMYVHLCPQFKN